MRLPELFAGAAAAVGAVVGAGLTLALLVPGPFRVDPAPVAELVGATILHVNDDVEWRTPTTLLEYEDGTRSIVTGYYGEPGDEFLARRWESR